MITSTKTASAFSGQGSLATVGAGSNRRSELTALKIFIAVLLANLVTIFIVFAVASSILSVNETNAALDRANQMGRQN